MCEVMYITNVTRNLTPTYWGQSWYELEKWSNEIFAIFKAWGDKVGCIQIVLPILHATVWVQ